MQVYGQLLYFNWFTLRIVFTDEICCVVFAAYICSLERGERVVDPFCSDIDPLHGSFAVWSFRVFRIIFALE